MPPNQRTRRIEVIHALVKAGDWWRLKKTLQRLDDVQIASQLDNLNPDELARALAHVDPTRRAKVLGRMRYEAAAQLLARLAPDEAASLLDALEADDAADILGRMDEEKLTQILGKLGDADQIEELLAYDERTAGGIMSTHVFRVLPDATVKDALAAIQAADEVPDHAFYVYVVEADGTLVGVCSLRMLVVARPEHKIRDIMRGEVVSVSSDTDQEEVADIVGRYDLVAVPVVDSKNRIVGAVEVDDVVDVIREEATEDILKMAGAGEELAEARSFTSSFRARWRWLMAAAFGGTLAALSLTGFDTALASVPALAFFMPVVAGMGGNIGMQSSTIVVRGLAVGFLEADRLRRLVVREVSLGMTLGMFYGLLIAGVALYVGAEVAEPWRLGLVVALGTAGSMTIASIVGTGTPLVLDRFGIDPAIATGPFVTTSVDVMGLLFYFWLAYVLLGLTA
jgi:magnesium transporter